MGELGYSFHVGEFKSYRDMIFTNLALLREERHQKRTCGLVSPQKFVYRTQKERPSSFPHQRKGTLNEHFSHQHRKASSVRRLSSPHHSSAPRIPITSLGELLLRPSSNPSISAASC